MTHPASVFNLSVYAIKGEKERETNGYEIGNIYLRKSDAQNSPKAEIIWFLRDRSSERNKGPRPCVAARRFDGTETGSWGSKTRGRIPGIFVIIDARHWNNIKHDGFADCVLSSRDDELEEGSF